MKTRESIITLFRKYGFKYRPKISKKSFLAFTYNAGFFDNAELVALEDSKNSTVLEEMKCAALDFEKLGFSTKKTFYKSLKEIEERLFNGFFNVEDWKSKINTEYKDHCNRILSVLPEQAKTYSYINVPYLKNNSFNENNIIEEICNELELNGPQLSIIEAPAGFGKTCTSYELIYHLVNGKSEYPIPFFTEFSRDRHARVFSHIFVREVDKSFSAVNSDVVIEAVKEGRITVVLDGFDELLHDSSNKKDDGFENAEPMLETISQLLVNNAKIILTSRRSAIFDGEQFHEWEEKHKTQFKINRFQLKTPELSDWLPGGRLKALNNTSVNVKNLANPVLLSFLRFVDDEYFKELCGQPSLVVEQYFQSMLEREMDRQDLRMSVSNQNKLLTLVATDMYENNYTSDSKDKIIDLIKDKASKMLKEVRSAYPAIDKPTIDKIATTLSNHAFFDRSNQEENNIQFVNEFVFGNYIANSVLCYPEEWMASDERFIEPAVLSYIPREQDKKTDLWEKLTPMCEFLDISIRMKFEAYLTGVINDSVYNDSDIASISLKRIKIFNQGSISHSLFNGITFTDCIFYLDNFSDITFLSCTFWNCTINSSSTTLSEVYFFNCNDNNGLINLIEDSDEPSESISKPDIKLYILSKIWPPGQSSISSIHYFTAKLFKTSLFSKKDIIKEIKHLKNIGLLTDAHDSNFIAVNKNKISNIKTILGK